MAHIGPARSTWPGIRDFAEWDLWNVRLHQSALAPENLTTLPHFSVSSAMNFPNSLRRARKHGAAKVSKARSRPAPSVGEADDLKIERQLIFVRSAERIGIDRSSAAREQRLLVSDAALTREGCKRIRQAVRQER